MGTPQPVGPEIIGATITGGHDGAPELVVKLKFENGVVTDVLMDNDVGVRLLALCDSQSVDALVGQPWQRLLQAVEGLE